MIKDKKGFMIFPREIMNIAIIVFLGIGLWFIYSSSKAWTMATLGLSEGATFIVGVSIVAIVLYFVKYKLPFRIG